MKQFGFSIDCFVKGPITMTRAFPKPNWVLLIEREKCLKFLKNSSQLFLEWMQWRIEYFPCNVDRVGNDNDLWDFVMAGSLVYTISNGK